MGLRDSGVLLAARLVEQSFLVEDRTGRVRLANSLFLLSTRQTSSSSRIPLGSRTASDHPGTVLRRFPQTWTLNIINRFFSFDFFIGKPPMEIMFNGPCNGPIESLVNPELSVLPWLLLFLVGFSLWWKARRRLALATLAGADYCSVHHSSFSISCLPRMQADVTNVINFSINIDSVARYYYPFFTACFLGVLSVWFSDSPATSTPPSFAK